jgi:hypothetical protein
MGLLPGIPVLHGSLVRLEPLSPDHAADLAVSAEEDRSAYGFTVVLRRDSAIFSVVAADWPATKAALCRRLAHSYRGRTGR